MGWSDLIAQLGFLRVAVTVPVLLKAADHRSRPVFAKALYCQPASL
jgi:hypothetical protein